MKVVNAGIGMLVLIFLASIFIPMYMSNSLATNTSGWNATMVALQNNYIPLLAMVGVLLLIIWAVFMRGKS
jgi:hypothetical protein